MTGLAKTSFLLLVLSLPFMKEVVPIDGLGATVTDLFFLISAGALGLAVVTGKRKLRWNSTWWILIIYFGAMVASALASDEPGRSALKLATQAYLVSLPVLAFNLIDSAEELHRTFKWWLIGTAATAGLGALTILLFFLGVDRSALDYGLHHYGTLAIGNYPRVESTFGFPAMLCNYLTVSLMILLISRQLGLIGAAPFYLLFFAIAVTAFFSLTPGLGGIFLAIGIWIWLALGHRARGVALSSLSAGIAAAVLFVLAAAVTPIIHSTAPFVIEVPGVEQQLAPAVRMMTWIDAVERLFRHPLLGVGIGMDAVGVRYVAPSGEAYFLKDAHNVFLNFAVQCGLIGLAAMVLLIVHVVRKTRPLRFEDHDVMRVGLGLAWLNAFVYQGLTGSYEDARHLWVLLGLLLVSIRFSTRTQPFTDNLEPRVP